MASPTGTGGEGTLDLETPLAGQEERVWRSFARAFVVVPRVLEAEIHDAHGVTMTEYFVLVNLSEAPDRQLRMSELAGRGAMSLSAISRVVDALERRGLVERMRCPSDRRGLLAVLTDRGLACLEEVYPTHLRGVREHVMRHLTGLDLDALADAVGSFAGGDRGEDPAPCEETASS
jgi:DNA-binding MarR family transcriptional regulator